MKTDENGMHLEEWPETGITETSYMPPGWLWICWIVSAVAFMVANTNQFYSQTEENPNFGPGWQAVEHAENFPMRDGRRNAYPSASDALVGESTSDPYTNPKESECYWGQYGLRR